MAAEIFPPAGVVLGTPDWGFQQAPDADVDIYKLGDGYESREPKGLNSVKESFSPSWSNLSPGPALQAYNFLKARLKWKQLTWTHPVTGATHKVTCQSVSITYDQWDNAILAASFKQDFNP